MKFTMDDTYIYFDYYIECEIDTFEQIKLIIRVPIDSYMRLISKLGNGSKGDEVNTYAVIIIPMMNLTVRPKYLGDLEAILDFDILKYNLSSPDTLLGSSHYRLIHLHSHSVEGSAFEFRIYIGSEDVEHIKSIVERSYMDTLIKIEADNTTRDADGGYNLKLEDKTYEEFLNSRLDEERAGRAMTRIILNVPVDHINKLRESRGSTLEDSHKYKFTALYKDITFLDVDENQHALGAICDAMKAMLMSKNRNYGDVASNPINVYNRQDALQSILARLDDKLARIKHSDTLRINDVADVAGYNMLLLSIIGTAQDILEMID
jgi:hypothetical protein